MSSMSTFSINELKYAQKYPFSKTAKMIVSASGLNLESVPESVIQRSANMVSAAFSGHPYSPKIYSHEDLLREEILAFPVAKVLISVINRFELNRKFSSMFSDAVLTYLSEEQDSVVLDTASELNISFDLSDIPGIFAEVPFQDYLKAYIPDSPMKLVNRGVKRGKVFLSRQELVKLISLVVSQQISDSLPVPLTNVPGKITSAAKNLDKEFSDALRKSFGKTDFGEVAPESFPPCMSKIYMDLLSGINVQHSARFAVATFLNSIGMPPENIISLFSKTPNFDARLTRYHVMRIAGQKGSSYSSPGCDKMRSYNLCVSNCPVNHPIQYYSNEKLRQTDSSDDSEENSSEEKSSEEKPSKE